MTLKSLSLSSILIIIIIVIINGGIGALGWPYIINSWLFYCGKSASVTALNGFVIGLPLGFVSIPLLVATWIIMLFL